jgi:type I restriction enzyme M protein
VDGSSDLSWRAIDRPLGKLENRGINNVYSSVVCGAPVLGLIFLRYADHQFTEAEKLIEKASTKRRKIGKADYQAKGVLYLPEAARFSTLLKLPEGENIGKEINDAMKAIEDDNEDLKGALPRTYNHLDNATLFELLKLMASIPMDIEGNTFGKIYEYFLGNFAMTEGQKGGEFFTPTSIVKLIVEVIEPFHGKIWTPNSKMPTIPSGLCLSAPCG